MSCASAHNHHRISWSPFPQWVVSAAVAQMKILEELALCFASFPFSQIQVQRGFRMVSKELNKKNISVIWFTFHMKIWKLHFNINWAVHTRVWQNSLCCWSNEIKIEITRCIKPRSYRGNMQTPHSGHWQFIEVTVWSRYSTRPKVKLAHHLFSSNWQLWNRNLQKPI